MIRIIQIAFALAVVAMLFDVQPAAKFLEVTSALPGSCVADGWSPESCR